MYTAEPDQSNGRWMILDPDGDYICSVLSQGQAAGLLSHLNRGM